MSRVKTRPFDMANTLLDEEDAAEYLRQVLADGDPALLAAALGDIGRARGMTQLARDTGLSRESLYKRLSDGRTIAAPLAWFPRLLEAAPEQRAHVEWSKHGLHWEALNEDISVAGMLAGQPGSSSIHPQKLLKQ